MGFFRRVFSADYRHALAAEAEGDYLAAARSYALCGEGGKVVEMHLRQASIDKDLSSRIRTLSSALGFAGQTPLRSDVLRRLGEALAEQARDLGPSTVEGRRSLREAAVRFAEGEHHEQSGDCWLELGDRDQAAAAYSRAGLVEKVEQVLSVEEERHDRRRREDSCFKDYELMLQGGQRDQAAAALRSCIEAAERKGEYRRLLADLEERLIRDNRVTLEIGSDRLVLVGGFPLLIGREPDCQLQVRGQSVSRRHARIVRAADGELLIEDLGSHNGTQLSGLPLGAPLPLPPSATIGLGESCAVAARLLDASNGVCLVVERGLDAGKQVVAGDGTHDLSVVVDSGPPLLVWFEGGRPMARPRGPTLMLNGARTGGPVQLIRDDLVELDGGVQIRVRG